eukprot:2055572-Heterocapsa_arctica.AAC.1
MSKCFILPGPRLRTTARAVGVGQDLHDNLNPDLSHQVLKLPTFRCARVRRHKFSFTCAL